MLSYKVFRQIADDSFLEIAQTTFGEDAEAVLDRYESGMVSRDGVIITTKNLRRSDMPALFKI